MSKREVWLTEREIGDLIWQDAKAIFQLPLWGAIEDLRIYRERPVSKHLIPDFLMFYVRNGVNVIEIIELKITASIVSLQQVAEYRNVLWNATMLWAPHTGMNPYPATPEIRLRLLARYFDQQVYEVAAAMGVELFRVDVQSKTELFVTDEEHSAVTYDCDVTSADLIARELRHVLPRPITRPLDFL